MYAHALDFSLLPRPPLVELEALPVHLSRKWANAG